MTTSVPTGSFVVVQVATPEITGAVQSDWLPMETVTSPCGVPFPVSAATVVEKVTVPPVGTEAGAAVTVVVEAVRVVFPTAELVVQLFPLSVVTARMSPLGAVVMGTESTATHWSALGQSRDSTLVVVDGTDPGVQVTPASVVDQLLGASELSRPASRQVVAVEQATC